MFISCYTIFLATILDILVGDPEWLYHPVRIMGAMINKLEQFSRRFLGAHMRIAGVLVVAMTILSTYILSFAILRIAGYANMRLAYMLEVLLIFFALSIKSLANEGIILSKLLRKRKINKAKQRLQTLVSRDLTQESENGLIRALLETLTENISDGIIAPLFFAILGGAPLAMAYKAVNTLDSMIGYKNKKYKDLGWCAAKLDDIANYIPARLTGSIIVLLSFVLFRHPFKAIRAWSFDAQKGPSPNGGIPIVTFAGALDIELGGDCSTSAGIIHIPKVGGNRKQLLISDIYWALSYIYLASTCAVLAYALLYNALG